MTQVYVHPLVADYFVERACDGSPESRQNIVSDYAHEQLILLRNVRIDADLAAIRSAAFPQTDEYRAVSASVLEWTSDSASPEQLDSTSASSNDPASRVGQKLYNEVFAQDWQRFSAFQGAFNAVNIMLRRIVEDMFDGFQFAEKSVFWNFKQTLVENLHFAEEKSCDTTEVIWAYINLDDAPCIWYVTHQLSTLFLRYYDELALSQFSSRPADALNAELTQRLFGGWDMRGREQYPRHMILFEPLDVWLCDGRRVPHQVAFSRRVVSARFSTVENGWPQHYCSFGEQLRALFAAAPAEVCDQPAGEDAGPLLKYPSAFQRPAGGAVLKSQKA